MPRKSIGEFAKGLGCPLYPYQEEIAEAIRDSVYNKRGTTISVLLARQMGKNEISAIVEAYLLMNKDNGTIIKAAPTYKPQVINSRQRLLKILEHPCIRKGVWQAHGYIVGVAPSPELCEVQAGARTLFFSADIGARVVGATASILLEIDEAQDVRIEKYNTDFRPMAATTNATTVLYGTAWTDNSLLAVVQAKNLELEKQDGIRRHFQYDWRTLAAINPNYKAYVEGEIARLGEEHRTIRTQYRLLPMEGGGYLFSELQHHLLSGQHQLGGRAKGRGRRGGLLCRRDRCWGRGEGNDWGGVGEDARDGSNREEGCDGSNDRTSFTQRTGFGKSCGSSSILV